MAQLVEHTQKASTGNPQAFPFVNLPPETQLRILEYTSLVSPTRLFTWSPARGFALPKSANTSASRLFWECPKSLFLVSRGIYRHAIDIFWKHNIIYVTPDISSFRQRPTPNSASSPSSSNPPTRYAASHFFRTQLSAETAPKVRCLSFEVFDATVHESRGHARKDWFNALEYISDLGLNLTCLYVAMTGSDDLEWERLDAAAPSSEDKIDLLRNFISSRVWPLNLRQSSPSVPRHLLVQIHTETASLRYELLTTYGDENIREPSRYQEERKARWGTPQATRQVNLQEQQEGDDDTSRGKASSSVESIWVHKLVVI